MTRMVNCIKLNKLSEGLASPPYPGELGQRIYEQVSKAGWDLWIRHQTMLINEYRLNLLDASSRRFLSEEMEKFFFGSGSEKPSGYVPPK
jgi:Fe-S cluster biosynthesis and repair protein YggX